MESKHTTQSRPRLLIVWHSPQAENPDACHAGLGITARNLHHGLLRYNVLSPYNVIAEPVIDGYHLRDKLRAPVYRDTTHVCMLAPFFDNGFLRVLLAEFPGIQFITAYHSNVPFLSVDKWASRMLIEQIALSKEVKNFSVGGNCEKFCETVEVAAGVPVAKAFNFYPVSVAPPLPSEARRKEHSVIHLGAFGALRQMKNLPAAAWAAGLIKRDTGKLVTLSINSGREEGPGAEAIAQVIKGICEVTGVTLIQEPWLSWEQFRRVLSTVHLILQPSFSESFNNVVADGISAGVPAVVGPAIYWTPENWKANPDDCRDIARIGLSLLADKHAVKQGWEALKEHNQRATVEWKKTLESGVAG